MSVTFGLGIFGVLISLFFLFLYISVCVWGYRDARRRGKSSEYALLVMIGLLFFPVIGVIVYLLIRDY